VWRELALAFGLMLIFEGIMPFLYPARWRNIAALLAEVADNKLRLSGLASMLAGTLLIYLLNHS
jgi:uncharacterized protein YjeT (DUF2065 family)